MPTTSPMTYPDWKAPAEDGQTLIWPPPAELLDQTRQNQATLDGCDAVRFQGLPLCDLRRRTRQWIGHDPDQPLIATGHQTELYHPGVWAKNALIHAAAEKLCGQAYHLAVDTDEPKHIHLRWPGAVEPITDDPHLATARWATLLAPPTPAHLNGLMDKLAKDAAGWPFTPMLPRMLESMRSLLLESPDLPNLIVNATHKLDWELGLRYHAMIASPLWTSETFLIYAHHLLSRADALAADYNAALDEYRLTHDIRSPGRPMPDLAMSDGDIECPFWLDDLDAGTRQRLHVRRDGDQWRLDLPGGDAFVFDPSADAATAADALLQCLRRSRHRIAPRALTLTLFIRLFIADNFVHGIGGGRYDQVLDRIIQRHFGIQPPHFAVTTATLHFPTAANRQRACLPCLRQQGHRLRHNILPDKRQLVAAIEQAPRRSRQRSLLFQELHRRLADAQDAPPLQNWQHHWAEALEQDRTDQVLFDRELFYAVQPRDRLDQLIQRYIAAF